MGKTVRRPYCKFQKQPAAIAIAKKIFRISREWPETISVELGEAIPLFRRDHEEVKFVHGQDRYRIKVLGRESVQEIELLTDAPNIVRRKLVRLCRRHLNVPFHFEA